MGKGEMRLKTAESRHGIYQIADARTEIGEF